MTSPIRLKFRNNVDELDFSPEFKERVDIFRGIAYSGNQRDQEEYGNLEVKESKGDTNIALEFNKEYEMKIKAFGKDLPPKCLTFTTKITLKEGDKKGSSG